MKFYHALLKTVTATIASCLLACGTKLPHYTAHTDAKSGTEVIRTVATQIGIEHPPVKPKTETIITATTTIDKATDTLVEQNATLTAQLEAEKAGSKKLFTKLLAWASIASGVGLAFSIAVALWFRTRTALFSAIAFGAFTVVTAILTVLMDWLIWIALGAGVLGTALTIWLVYDHIRDTKPVPTTPENPNEPNEPNKP